MDNPTDNNNLHIMDGLSVRLQVAPIGKRFLALMIDYGIVSCLLWILYVLFALFIIAVPLFKWANLLSKELTLTFLIIVILALACAYHAYFIYFEYKKGKTPGKMIFGLQVISLTGQKLSLKQAILRQVLRDVDNIMFLPGIASVLLTEKRQRLGDLAAKTMVTYSEQKEKASQSFYLPLEKYHFYLDEWQPQRPNLTLAQSYLKQAFPVFILQSKEFENHERNYFRNEFLKICLNPAHIKSSDDDFLRFMAEHCLQYNHKS